jgi:hypothetical protein
MALPEAKSARVPRVTASIHHGYHLSAEISVWGPIVALGAVTLAAYIILWLRVAS